MGIIAPNPKSIKPPTLVSESSLVAEGGGLLVGPGSVPTVKSLLAEAGIAVFGHAPPGAQHAALPSPKTLLEVEAWAKEVNEVLKSFGFTA